MAGRPWQRGGTSDPVQLPFLGLPPVDCLPIALHAEEVLADFPVFINGGSFAGLDLQPLLDEMIPPHLHYIEQRWHLLKPQIREEVGAPPFRSRDPNENRLSKTRRHPSIRRRRHQALQRVVRPTR